MTTSTPRPSHGRQPPLPLQPQQQRRYGGWYALLAALRVVAAVGLSGMIHPDEFFQSQEVMAAHVLATEDPALRGQLHIPWEYQLPTPNRSVLFPALVAGGPYAILQVLGVPMTGTVLLLVPRVLLCLASFAIDALLYYSAKAIGVKEPMLVVLSFASAWTTLVFLSRPFSNTFETVILALSMGVLVLYPPHKRILGVFHIQTLLLGSLLAVGVFTRFTFPCFFLPIGLELVRRQDEALVVGLLKKGQGVESSLSFPVILQRLLRAAWIGVQGLVAFLTWSCVFIVMDTMYFRGKGPVEWKTLGDLVIAPWNNFVYNTQYDNLELHGVHPRVAHAAVNMQLLFGPLFLLFLIYHLYTGTNGKDAQRTGLRLWSLGCVVIPLTLLSLAPHQEPRFLLPLVVPLHLFTPSVLTSRRLRLIWIAFNILLTVFFGILHQGGLVPLLLTLSSQHGSGSVLTGRFGFGSCVLTSDLSSHPLVFYKTYMPPRFLLAATVKHGDHVRVLDLAGGQEMTTMLQGDLGDVPQITVIAPASVDVDQVATIWGSTKTSVVGQCSPHVSTEDLALDKPFELILYSMERL